MGSEFGGTWEDPEGGFIKFAVKRASKQDQTLHMEGKLQFIRYFSRECTGKPSSKYLFSSHCGMNQKMDILQCEYLAMKKCNFKGRKSYEL